MDLKEEVQFTCKAGKHREAVTVPRESRPQREGVSVPLHQQVPVGPDDPSQLDCAGSPSEGWDEAPWGTAGT